jgi:hypothetical protein
VQTANGGAHPHFGNENMRTPAYTEDAAIEASRRTLLAPGWIDGAVIREAADGFTAQKNEKIELFIAVPDGRGGERLFKDHLTATPLGALRLRHACEAIGALDRYMNEGEVSASDFVGHTVRVKIEVEKKRGPYGPRNIITDYAKAEPRVVSLREVAS